MKEYGPNTWRERKKFKKKQAVESVRLSKLLLFSQFCETLPPKDDLGPGLGTEGKGKITS